MSQELSPQEEAQASNTEQPIETKKAEIKPKKSGRHWIWIVVVVLFLSLCGGIGFLGYTGWQYWQQLQSQLQQQKIAVATATQQAGRAREQMQSSQAVTEKLIQQQNSEIKVLRSELVATARRFTESQGITRYEWLLAEAEYLMRLAQQRVHLQQDAEGALSILQSADAVLRDAKDAGLIDVRAALAKEMAELARVPQVDKVGVFLKLKTLIDGVKDLTWQQRAVVVNSEPEEPQPWWQRFKNIVKIRPIEQGFEYPAPVEQQQLIQNLIRLNLEQAQSALLNDQPKLFSTSLEQAEGWLKRYYGHLEESELLMRQIAKQKNLILTPELPELGLSLKLLKGYIAEVYRLHRSAPEVESRQ